VTDHAHQHTSLRQRLREGPALVGTFSIVAAPEVIEIIALAGFDLVVLDMEHGSYGIENVGVHILAARAGGALTPVVRVRSNDPAVIGAVLDAGAAGVIVPHVQSAADASAAVRAARFPPDGERGAHPWVRAVGYGASGSWQRRANDEIAVIVMVEGREGVAALDEILATPGVDAVFIGPVDLATSLGLAGDLEHPDVVAAVADVIVRAQAAGVAAAVFSASVEGAGRWRQAGARLITVGVDTQIALAAFTAVAAGAGTGTAVE
jgi:4-hydroxy-2-oxoheptanedioate aldolase